jgi:hypothetical protein
MANIGIILTAEEKRRILAPYLDPPPGRPVPKPKVVTLATKTELSVEAQRERIAREAAELLAKEKREAADLREMADFHLGQSSVHDEAAQWARRKQTEIIHPLEVDGQGRVSLARRIDCETGEQSLVEFEGGYRPQPGAVSDYNPLAALRRPEDE